MSHSLWIGIQGGTCAGKTKVSHALANVLGSQQTLVLSLDSFYLPFDKGRHSPLAHNFDDPVSLDWDIIHQTCESLAHGTEAIIPSYDFISGLRSGTRIVKSRPYVIVEGIFAYWSPALFKRFDLRVFVDVPQDIGLLRRLRRDVAVGARGWSLQDAIEYYEAFTRPAHSRYVEPGKIHAHILLNGEEDLAANVEKVREHITKLLLAKSDNRIE
jgi:uridine kinase